MIRIPAAQNTGSRARTRRRSRAARPFRERGTRGRSAERRCRVFRAAFSEAGKRRRLSTLLKRGVKRKSPPRARAFICGVLLKPSGPCFRNRGFAAPRAAGCSGGEAAHAGVSSRAPGLHSSLHKQDCSGLRLEGGRRRPVVAADGDPKAPGVSGCEPETAGATPSPASRRLEKRPSRRGER